MYPRKPSLCSNYPSLLSTQQGVLKSYAAFSSLRLKVVSLCKLRSSHEIIDRHAGTLGTHPNMLLTALRRSSKKSRNEHMLVLEFANLVLGMIYLSNLNLILIRFYIPILLKPEEPTGPCYGGKN